MKTKVLIISIILLLNFMQNFENTQENQTSAYALAQVQNNNYETDNEQEKKSLSLLKPAEKVKKIFDLVEKTDKANIGLILFIEHFDIFSSEEVISFVNKALSIKDINKIYLGYLLNDKLEKLTITTINKIALFILSDDSTYIFTYRAFGESSQNFSEESQKIILNSMITKLNLKLKEFKGEKKAAMFFASISMSTDSSQDDSNSSIENKINYIFQELGDTSFYQLYYIFISLFKNYDKLTIENKKVIHDFLDNPVALDENISSLSSIIDQLDGKIYQIVYNSIKKSDKGFFYLLVAQLENKKPDFMKPDIFLSKDNFKNYSEKSINFISQLIDEIPNDKKSVSILLLLINYYPKFPVSLQNKIQDSFLKGSLKIINNLGYLYSFKTLPESLQLQLIEKHKNVPDSIPSILWFLMENNQGTTQKLKNILFEISKSNPKTFYLFMIDFYNKFPKIEREKTLKKLVKDKENSIYATLIIRNNFNLIDESLRNKLIETLSQSNSLNKIPLSYLFIENFDKIPEKFRKKLLEYSKDKKLSTYISKGIFYNFRKLGKKYQSEIINSLKKDQQEQTYLIRTIGRNYHLISKPSDKAILGFTKDPMLRKIILSTLFSGEVPDVNKRDELIEQYLNDPDAFWDILMMIESTNFQYYSQKILQHKDLITSLKTVLEDTFRYKTIKNIENPSFDEIINNGNFDLNLAFYKNWAEMPENLKKEFGPVLFDLLTDSQLYISKSESRTKLQIYYGRLITILENNLETIPEPFRERFISDLYSRNNSSIIVNGLLNDGNIKKLPDKFILKLLKNQTEKYSHRLLHPAFKNYFKLLNREEKIALISESFLRDENMSYSGDSPSFSNMSLFDKFRI